MTVLAQKKQKNEVVGQLATAVPRIAIIIVAAYIGAQMLADITSLKIGLVAGYAVDMGTFIYPITFTLRDVVHKLLGKRNAQALIIMAAVINLFMAVYLTWAAGIPSDPILGAGYRVQRNFRAAVAHRHCLNFGRGGQRANRHRSVSLVCHPYHRKLSMGSRAAQQQHQPPN